MHQPIAIFDSGVGGLTVAKEVMRQLPQETIVYCGDTARAPYGPRSADEIVQFTLQVIDFLLQSRPKMIVIACNTATAFALEVAREYLHIPIIGVIHPGARAAIKSTHNDCVGVIGTEGTIRSGAYEHALKQISPHIEVFSLACPEFVPLVEQGLFHQKETFSVVQQSLFEFSQIPMDCLILGCTHYPFLSDMIGSVMGPEVKLISSAEETAREISAILYHKGLLAEMNPFPRHQFYCSGDPLLFKTITQNWLGRKVQVSLVDWSAPHIISSRGIIING